MPRDFSQTLLDLLVQRFGPEWEALSASDQFLVYKDFAEMVRDEYDAPDDTVYDGIAEDNAVEASREYRRRIGGGNLKSYVAVLRVH